MGTDFKLLLDSQAASTSNLSVDFPKKISQVYLNFTAFLIWIFLNYFPNCTVEELDNSQLVLVLSQSSFFELITAWMRVYCGDTLSSIVLFPAFFMSTINEFNLKLADSRVLLTITYCCRECHNTRADFRYYQKSGKGIFIIIWSWMYKDWWCLDCVSCV